MQKYNILQFYEDQRTPRVLAVDLTLDQAKHICGLKFSSGQTAEGVKWFYGFQKNSYKQ